MAITYESSTVETNVEGATLHSNEAGSGPVLCGFHGGGPGANAWDNTKNNIEALAEHFHVILLDLPGFGRSEFIAPDPNLPSDVNVARSIKAFLDARGIEKTHLYGTSMSGHPALRFGLDYPDRIDKIVLKSPGALGVPNLMSTTPPDGIRALEVFRDDPTLENMRTMMELFFPMPGVLTEQMIESRFDNAVRNLRPVSRTAPQSNLLHDVAALRAPVLALWGKEDHMVPLDGALVLLAAIPNVRVHMWGGPSGHFVEWEHPREFERLVINFLRFDE